MDVVKNVANILQIINRKNFIDLYSLSNNDSRVNKLKSIEKTIKRTYKISTRVVYVDAKYKKLLIDTKVKGYYNAKEDYAVVFVNNKCQQVIETLCHELTHAYQNKHMHSKYIASTKALREGRVSYSKAWHEVHAKTEASSMCNYFLNKAA